MNNEGIGDIIVFSTFALLLLLGSCIHIKPRINQEPKPVKPAVEGTLNAATKGSAELDKSTDVIDKAAYSIKDEATAVENKVPEPTKKEVKPHVKKIKEEADSIIKETGKIDKVSTDLQVMAADLRNVLADIDQLSERGVQLQTALDDSVKQAKNLEKERDEAIAAKNTALTRALQYMMIAGTVIVALSMMLVFTGEPRAVKGALAGGTLILTAMAVMVLTKLEWLFILLGALGILTIVGIMIYHLIDYLRHKRGLHEAVETVEVAKEHMSNQEKENVFGPPGLHGRAGIIQSDGTKALVKDIKNKLRGNDE